MAPIEIRKAELLKKKETFQFKRDVEDEKIWIEEKMALASSQEVRVRILDLFSYFGFKFSKIVVLYLIKTY